MKLQSLVHSSHSYVVFHHKLQNWQEVDILWVVYLNIGGRDGLNSIKIIIFCKPPAVIWCYWKADGLTSTSFLGKKGCPVDNTNSSSEEPFQPFTFFSADATNSALLVSFPKMLFGTAVSFSYKARDNWYYLVQIMVWESARGSAYPYLLEPENGWCHSHICLPSRQLTVHWQPTMLKLHYPGTPPGSQNCHVGRATM